jgi:hypothetical protein
VELDCFGELTPAGDVASGLVEQFERMDLKIPTWRSTLPLDC